MTSTQEAQAVIGPEWLDAGAVLPGGSVPADETTDTLTARAYRHPVLGDQVVVALVPEIVGPAEDLTMEFLGFEAPQAVTEVGVVRRQALGFPGWVLVHDPANAHHALAVVKEIERLARVARTRGKLARDGFVALGGQLARSVPGFLPSYYEEAARAFLAADSPTYAATMFGKAREAEKSYGLPIDEDRQHTAFLEFALAGALTATALSGYARDLAQRCAPDVAYERFYRLCLERVLGGLPPYATMHADLRRLAKAAGLGPEADERLLTDVRGAASVLRAPRDFWVAYRPVLARMARRDPAVPGWLLSILPKECQASLWLAILEEAGATAALTGPAGSVPAEAESPDGPAGWLARFNDRYSRWGRGRTPELLALAERMAGRLAADGVPVALGRGNVDLDLVDLCLALGVPLAPVERHVRCSVANWLADKAEGRRDLAAVAAHDQLRQLLAGNIEDYLEPGRDGKAAAERVATVAAVPGLRAALHWWLGRLADAVPGWGLPALPAQLDRVNRVACPDGLAVNPGAVTRIAGHDLGPALGRTLRAGIMDEYRWPALEAAVAGFGPQDRAATEIEVDRLTFALTPQWPALIVRVGSQVAVVGSEVEHEHLLRIPGKLGEWRRSLRYADGQLLVTWGHWNQPYSAYWSGAADDVFTLAPPGYHQDGFDASIALPDGGRTAGHWPLHAGDHSPAWRGRVMSDGHTYWTWTNPEDGNPGWHEYDPMTGKLGRRSLPAFLEDGAVDGEPLVLANCRLVPAPASLASSPLGFSAGLVGWRLRTTPGGGVAGEAIDGRSFALAGEAWEAAGENGAGALLGAVRFPGSDASYGVIRVSRYRGNYYKICADDGFEVARYPVSGQRSGFAAGTPLLASAAYWHYLVPRDEAGSAALRACSDELAATLLGRAEGLDHNAVRALVRELLPQVNDDRLAAGIAGIVQQAAASAGRLAEFRAIADGQSREQPSAAVDPAEAAAAAAGKPTDSALSAARQGLMSYCQDRGYSAVRLLEQVGSILAGPSPDQTAARSLPDADKDWLGVLSRLRAVMYRAVCPATPPPHRKALLAWLEVCAGCGLLAPGGRLRLLHLEPDEGQGQVQRGDIIEAGTHRVLGLAGGLALDYAPDGTFGPVPGFRIEGHAVYDTQGVTPEMITAFVARARQEGPLPWSPGLPAALSGEAGLSLAEATAVLAGLPEEETWKQAADADWRRGSPVSDEAADCARMSWSAWSAGARALGLLLPADPATAWETGPTMGRLAAWLNESRGTRPPVADALIIAARAAQVATGMTASGLLHGLSRPDTCRWLTGRLPGRSDLDVLKSMVRAVPWVAGALPGDHPLRQALPAALELARGRLADPDAVFDLGWVPDGKVADLTAAAGGPVTSDEHGTTAGPLLILPGSGSRPVHLRPAGLASPDGPLLAVLAATLVVYDDQPVALMRALLSEHMTTWATYQVPEAAIGAEHDPSRAVPDLVREAAGRHGLSADAAALYLQVLALPDPTDRKTAEWTGWPLARLKAARAELAATDLVVEGTRARAGRTLFLPGGWIARKAPLPLPMESWKQPLIIGGLEHILIPVAPSPRIFEVAWQRVRDGDGPRFDDLVLERRR